MFAPLLYGLCGLGLGSVVVKKVFNEDGTDKSSNPNSSQNNNNYSPQHPNSQQLYSQQPQTIVVQQPDSSTRLKTTLVWGGSVVIMCVYYYLTHRQSTKEITNKVEETAGETQDLVKECDDNNEKRISELEQKNQQRKNELSEEIRGESRAQFQVIRDQLKLLGDVSVETLKQVANNIVGNDDNELNDNRDISLLELVDTYENQNEINMSDTAYLQAHEESIKEVQEDIRTRENNKNKNNNNINKQFNKNIQFVTPGGPDDYNTPGGPNDHKDNEKSFITNVTSYFKSSPKNGSIKMNDDTEDNNSKIFSKVMSLVGGKPYTYAVTTTDFVSKHRDVIMITFIGVVTYTGLTKIATYIENKHKNKSITIQH